MLLEAADWSGTCVEARGEGSKGSEGKGERKNENASTGESEASEGK